MLRAIIQRLGDVTSRGESPSSLFTELIRTENNR